MDNSKVFREPSASEVRAKIDGMPDVVEIPMHKGTMKVETNLVKTLDKFLLLSGCRISEVVTEQSVAEAKKGLNNYGYSLSYNVAAYRNEEIAVWTITTLKRQDKLVRSIALPLNPEYEPWTRDIIEAWRDGNPWSITRGMAYQVNRKVFDGLQYMIRPQVIYQKDGDGKTVKNGSGKSIVQGVNPQHPKPISDHGLRHIRIKQLIMEYGFTPIEVQRWIGWTAGTLGSQGINPMMDSYFSLGWQDYIPKLLVKRTW